MKKVLFLSLASLFATTLLAQTEFNYVLSSDGAGWHTIQVAPTKQQSLGNETMEFFYDYSFQMDTLNPKSLLSDQMILQLNDTLSRFSSFTNLRIDSILSVKSQKELMEHSNQLKGGETFSVFKNYPKGKLTFTDQISTDWYRFEEEIPSFNWTFIDSTKVILGYHCQRAECNFRGRHYIAWYTLEIPISNGPWKFGGLPGMILEIADSRGQYTFTLIGITPKGHRSINMPQLKYFNTTRAKYYKVRYKFDYDPFDYFATVSGINITLYKADGSLDTERKKPKKMTYTYIEKDVL